MYIEVSRAYSDKVNIGSDGESNDTAPIFTPLFRDGLLSLKRAAQDPESDDSIHLAKRFIHNFGTHFFSTAYMGATQVIETTFERMAKSKKETDKRSKCINKAYQNGASKGFGTKKVDLTIDAEVRGVGVTAGTTFGGDGYSTSESFLVSFLCYSKMMNNKVSQQRFLHYLPRAKPFGLCSSCTKMIHSRIKTPTVPPSML